jgi:hypothetical protein
MDDEQMNDEHTEDEHTDDFADAFEPIKRLAKDLREASKSLTTQEVRYLVDLYYQIQDFRVQAGSEIKAMTKSKEPARVINWVYENQRRIEVSIKSSLVVYSDNESTGMGLWAKDVYGIGPVMASGLLAHIEMEPWRCANRLTIKKTCRPNKPCRGGKCGRIRLSTAGQIWRFAGLDPTAVWKPKQKRPWNAKLKILCWKLGESFWKFHNKPECVYGHLMEQRKNLEWERNEAGAFADQCAAILRGKEFKKDSEAPFWYGGQLTVEAGRKVRALEMTPERINLIRELAVEPGKGVPMLPPAHIHARARRYTVKIFLSHWHAEAYRRYFKEEPPAPYPIAILGHAHKI